MNSSVPSDSRLSRPVGFPNVPNIEIPAYSMPKSNSNNMFAPPPPGETVSMTSTTRMKTYGSHHLASTVPQQTRHARRIYVGGIPVNCIDEDIVRSVGKKDLQETS